MTTMALTSNGDPMWVDTVAVPMGEEVLGRYLAVIQRSWEPVFRRQSVPAKHGERTVCLLLFYVLAKSKVISGQV